MKLNLCSYLIENKGRILETWKRYLESNPENGPLRKESVYRDLLGDTHTEIIAMLHDTKGRAWTSSPFHRPLCYYIHSKSPRIPDKDLCHKLYQAGLKAYQDVLMNVEPPYEYYTKKEIDLYSKRIKEAFQTIIQRETNSSGELNLNHSRLRSIVNN